MHPKNHLIIGTNLDANGIIAQNKVHPVEKGHNQEECIDYNETYALVACLKAINLHLFHRF